MYLQTQQTLASPHFPIGTPPIPRHVKMEAQLPCMEVVCGDPGIIDVTTHDGPGRKDP